MIAYVSCIKDSVGGSDVEIAVTDCAENTIELNGMTRPQLIDLLTRLVNQLSTKGK